MERYSRDRFPLARSVVSPVKTAMPKRKRRAEVVRDLFALGPIPLSVAGAAGRAGPWCMSVLLAVRARADMSRGQPVEATWIAAVLGANFERFSGR